MATFVSDGFSGTNWTDLHLRDGEVGADWTRHPSWSSSRWYLYNNRVHCGIAGVMYASGVPDSADYSVTATMRYYSNRPSRFAGVAGRVDTSADSHYAATYQDGQFVLLKRVTGSTSSLGWWASSLSGGAERELTLDMSGTTIRLLVDGTERISVTDASISSAGRAGLRAMGSSDASEGIHFDNFTAEDGAAVFAGGAQTVFVGL